MVEWVRCRSAGRLVGVCLSNLLIAVFPSIHRYPIVGSPFRWSFCSFRLVAVPFGSFSCRVFADRLFLLRFRSLFSVRVSVFSIQEPRRQPCQKSTTLSLSLLNERSEDGSLPCTKFKKAEWQMSETRGSGVDLPVPGTINHHRS